MKLKQLLIAGTILGSASLANADDRTFGNGTLSEFLQQFDLNEDGVLDEEERQAMIEARKEIREKRRAAIDTDGDGIISPEERKAARDLMLEKIAEKRAERFAEIAGEDGVLSLEEFSALPPFKRASAERVASLFARLDTDESGGVDLDEFVARLRSHLPPVPPTPRPGGDDGEDDENEEQPERPVRPPVRPTR